MPLKLYKQPRLKNPYLVVGWLEAGMIGVGGIDYPINQLKAEELGEVEASDFL
ncbi:hypothetical protein ACFLW3_01570 [Chloroflexota bacterium]